MEPSFVVPVAMSSDLEGLNNSIQSSGMRNLESGILYYLSTKITLGAANNESINY